jgi:hypothetical protein
MDEVTYKFSATRQNNVLPTNQDNLQHLVKAGIINWKYAVTPRRVYNTRFEHPPLVGCLTNHNWPVK